MTSNSSHSPSNRAPARTLLDNSSCGMGDVPQGAFYSCPPLVETGPDFDAAIQPSRDQVLLAWFGTALFWLGEILGAASLLIILIIGLFFGEIFQ